MSAVSVSRGRDPAVTVHDRVFAQAGVHPEAVATRDDHGELRYGELAAGARALAARLLTAGARAGERVGVVASRDRRTPVALLAAMATGAAYVPLDPTWPAARLRAVLDRARPVAVVVPDPGDEGALAAATADGRVGRVGLGDRSATPDNGTAAPALPRTRAEDPAYVMFTSGSTGEPKGVVVPHRAVLALLDHMRDAPGLAAGETMLSLTTPAFDLCVPDLFLPLVVGATTRFVPRADTVDGRALRRRLETGSTALLQATPATWRLLLDAGWPGDPGLGVVCGGEAYDAGLARALATRVGAVWNCYGPTETTVWSTITRLGPDVVDPVPLGPPVRGTHLAVLDAAGAPTCPGDVGELVIGGAGVALGYFESPDLTAAAFRSDPDGPPGARRFHTGDLVRLGSDGGLSFVGRRDDQVKIRGHRVELGDVEAALRACPGVGRAAVVVAAGPRLAAFVVADGDGAGLARAALAAAAERLPPASVPASVGVLPALPLTANGKLDRRALVTLADAAAVDVAPTPTEEPWSPIETEIAAIWRELLGRATVGLDDDFFDSGGTSLVATGVAGRLAERLGVELRVVEIFEAPTVRGLAGVVLGQLVAADDDVVAAPEACA